MALALRSRDPEALHAILREIGDGNEATARMVHQLLALARSDSRVEPPAEQVDLVEIARQAAFDLLPPALRKGSEIAFDDDGPLPIRGLPLLLRELVLNLVDNAIRYTPPGAAIEVSVRRHREHAQLVVRDNGPGIDAAERERVFDRFYRLAGSPSDGAGLGLAIVAQIVRMHGATIALAAAQGDGGGLCVRVSFSAVEATQPTAAGAAEGGATLQPGRLHRQPEAPGHQAQRGDAAGPQRHQPQQAPQPYSGARSKGTGQGRGMGRKAARAEVSSCDAAP